MLRKISYQHKLLFVYGGIVAAVFAAFLTIYCCSRVRSAGRMTDNTMEQLASRAVSQFEILLNEMSDISLSLAVNTAISDVLKEAVSVASPNNYFAYNPQAKGAVQREIISVSGTRFSNKSFNVISGNYDGMSLTLYDSARFDKEQLWEILWIREMLEEKTSKCILPVGADSYGRTEERTFSFARLVQDEFMDYGLVEVQYGEEWLKDIFRIELQEQPVLGVVLYQDGLFYATQPVEEGLLDGLLEEGERMNGSQELGRRELGGRTYVVCASALENYEMKVFFLIEEGIYEQPVRRDAATILVLGGLMLILIIGVVYMISWTMNKPIRQLRDEIEHMDYEKLSLLPQVETTNDEIVRLTNAFHRMLTGVRRSRDELIEARTRELKANYEVLQAQINPHFMHNILSVIGLMGYQKNAPEIMEICSLLTRMLQYTTKTGTPVVKLEQELTHVKIYLKLMGYRYLEKLTTDIQIEEGMGGIEVPKFILQPVTENCFLHSLAESTAPKYEIIIRGRCTKRGWELKIMDNGVGFTQEAADKLEGDFRRLREQLTEGTCTLNLEIGGMALINTYARLMIHCRGKIRLQVSNRPEGGSCVTFICERREQNDESADC